MGLKSIECPYYYVCSGVNPNGVLEKAFFVHELNLNPFSCYFITNTLLTILQMYKIYFLAIYCEKFISLLNSNVVIFYYYVYNQFKIEYNNNNIN